MAEHKSKEMQSFEDLTSAKAIGAQTAYDAKVRRFTATIDLAENAVKNGDTVLIAKVPKEYRFAYGLITSSVSLGTATVSVSAKNVDTGAATAGKYRPAAVMTTASQPVLFGAAGAGAAKTAPEEVYLEIATADLPASGTLQVDLFFSAAL